MFVAVPTWVMPSVAPLLTVTLPLIWEAVVSSKLPALTTAEPA